MPLDVQNRVDSALVLLFGLPLSRIFAGDLHDVTILESESFWGEVVADLSIWGRPQPDARELSRQCRHRSVWCSGEVGVPAVKVVGELVVEDTGADL